MFYSIRHATRFHYSAPVSESNMELRMRPRSEGHQRCLKHEIKITPRVRVSSYRDYLGNTVHFFDVPAPHTKLLVVSEAVVEVDDLPVLPPALPHSAWEEIDALYDGAEHWEMQNPSRFPVFSQKLSALAAELGAERREDPLTLLRELNAALFESFRYLPKSTRVDSPIDEAIHNRAGVCQDFTHIMIALVRRLKIPCRYVSGYLFPRTQLEERSALGATHAWLEALLPGLGWVGFDPTNNELCNARHIRTAVGRDYADVPPTRGVFKGHASSELAVAVRVSPTAAPTDESDDFHAITPATLDLHEVGELAWDAAREQQQQQQQQ